MYIIYIYGYPGLDLAPSESVCDDVHTIISYVRFRSMSDDQLANECGITNSIHRTRILNSRVNITVSPPPDDVDSWNQSLSDVNKVLDVFISYERCSRSAKLAWWVTAIWVVAISEFGAIPVISCGCEQAFSELSIVESKLHQKCLKNCKNAFHFYFLSKLLISTASLES